MHSEAVTAAGTALIRFAQSCGLIRGEWIAIDGSKFRAVASVDSTRTGRLSGTDPSNSDLVIFGMPTNQLKPHRHQFKGCNCAGRLEPSPIFRAEIETSLGLWVLINVQPADRKSP
jgi:hypothetical protein